MNYKKIYDLISKYKNKIDELEEHRQNLNDKQDYEESEFFLGQITSLNNCIKDLEKFVDDEFGSLELLIHEHKAEELLSNYENSELNYV